MAGPTLEKLEKDNDTEIVPLWRSCRGLLAIVSFLGTVMVYALRMDMSVGILCMTNHTALALRDVKGDNKLSGLRNSSEPLPPNDMIAGPQCETQRSNTSTLDGPFEWDAVDRSIVLGAFFYGYLVSQIPAGILVQKTGPKFPLLICSLVNAIATILIPLCETFNSYGLLLALRGISGLASGFWFPCIYQMWSHWAPPLERSKLVGFCNAGVHIGNALTLPIAGFLCQYGFAGGWPSIFYLFGIASLLWCILWACLVHDVPSVHPRISVSEKNYIAQELKGQISNDKKLSLPMVSILKCVPFWAILVVNVAFDWNGYLFLTNVPTYMKDVLKVDISANGLLSALPYIGFWVGQMGAAFLADFITQRNILSITWTRKLMTSVGMFGPGLLLIVLANLDCTQKSAAVAVLTLALTLKSGCFLGALMNHVDIAPRYAGLLFAFTNSVAATTGFAAPRAVGAITYKGLPSQWTTVFYISTAVYVFGGVVYLIFGSAELQPWASIESTGNMNTEEMCPLKMEVEENADAKGDSLKAITA